MDQLFISDVFKLLVSSYPFKLFVFSSLCKLSFKFFLKVTFVKAPGKCVRLNHLPKVHTLSVRIMLALVRMKPKRSEYRARRESGGHRLDSEFDIASGCSHKKNIARCSCPNIESIVVWDHKSHWTTKGVL